MMIRMDKDEAKRLIRLKYQNQSTTKYSEPETRDLLDKLQNMEYYLGYAEGSWVLLDVADLQLLE